MNEQEITGIFNPSKPRTKVAAMSAQDFPTIKLPTQNRVRGAHLPLGTLFFEIVRLVGAELVRRHKLWRLTKLDDAQLRDYGLEREDLVSALSAPLIVNATLALEEMRRRAR
ncbi:MAG: hypothetical protein AAFR13_05365 [Pseudomonadota bacterium]